MRNLLKNQLIFVTTPNLIVWNKRVGETGAHGICGSGWAVRTCVFPNLSTQSEYEMSETLLCILPFEE